MIVRGNVTDAKKLFEVSKTQSGNRITKLLHPEMNEKTKEEKKDNKKEVSNPCVFIIIVVIMYSPHSLVITFLHVYGLLTYIGVLLLKSLNQLMPFAFRYSLDCPLVLKRSEYTYTLVLVKIFLSRAKGLFSYRTCDRNTP